MISSSVLIKAHLASSADSTLVVFMCRGVEEEGKSIVTVFDLNAWYNSQVPLHPGWSDVNKMG